MGRLPTWSEKKTPSRVKAGSLTRFRKQYLRIASLVSILLTTSFEPLRLI